MKENNLVSNIFPFSLLLAEIGQRLEIVNDVFLAVPVDAALNEIFTDLCVIRSGFGTRSSVNMLRSMA